MTLLLACIGVTVVIVGLEYFFWRMFRAKIEGLLFPHETDTSSLHFFTLGRIRACGLLHTVGLTAVCILTILFFW